MPERETPATTMIITSIQNPRVKQAVRLRDRRGREQQGRLVIDGVRETRRALEGGVRLAEVFFCEAASRREAPPGSTASNAAGPLADLRQNLLQRGIRCWDVAGNVFSKLSFGQRDEGVVAVGETPAPTLANWNVDKPMLIAVLEGVEKPGNVGAVLRTADAAGVSGVILADPATDLFNPNTIRASLGAVFTLPVCVADSRQTRQWLLEHGLRILVARVDASLPYYEASFTIPTAVVLGSEALGVSSSWMEAGMQAVHLPMLGKVDSLNVSVTAAVLFYEAARQRGCR
jgi:TrmH family RNA methyltransferase